MEAFRDCFPKGVVNFISGAGRDTSERIRCPIPRLLRVRVNDPSLLAQPVGPLVGAAA